MCMGKLLLENNQCQLKVKYFHISLCPDFNDTKNAYHVTNKVETLNIEDLPVVKK